MQLIIIISCLINVYISANLQLSPNVIRDCLHASKRNFINVTSAEKSSGRKVCSVADTLDNTGNEALAESDNYFN